MVSPFRMAGWGLSLALAGGCGSPAGPDLQTGLTGSVTRGPITPVCIESVPCEAPFAASFTVVRAGRRVGVFRSDEAGQFEVRLAPGDYQVVPAADAPLVAPESQSRSVTVGPVGLTPVALQFDTGIR
jgi:hypothetical protein